MLNSIIKKKEGERRNVLSFILVSFDL